MDGCRQQQHITFAYTSCCGMPPAGAQLHTRDDQRKNPGVQEEHALQACEREHQGTIQHSVRLTKSLNVWDVQLVVCRKLA